MMAAGKLSTRNLTKHLTELGQQIHTVDDEGNPITREQALAELLWKKALGWIEETRDDEGTLQKVVHKPESWAIQYIYERREGKSIPTLPDDADRVRASDRVRELAKQRLNQLATVAAGAPAKKSPPAYKPKEKP
jgi:hypothetical protein